MQKIAFSLGEAPRTQGVDGNFSKVLFRTMCESNNSQASSALGRTTKLFSDPSEDIAAGNAARISLLDGLVQHGQLQFVFPLVVL
jgi:hypothetical protein